MPAKKKPAKKKDAKPRGRPSLFTQAISDAIIADLIEGKSLVEICQSDSMPNRMTVLRWMEKHPDFAAGIARAREEQAEYMDHLVNKTANECTPDNAAAARVKIAAYQWRAAKLKPKSFGDNSSLKIDQTNRTAPMTNEQLVDEMKQSPAFRKEMEELIASAKNP